MRIQRRNSGCGVNFWNQQLDRGLLMESPPPSKLLPINDSSSPFMQSSLPTSSGVGGSSVGDGGFGYIEHTVTKFDTLAGVAIKYGVEVADIKKMNGLTTDLQMFARKTLHIPLPGRHPPSPIMSNGQGPKHSEMTPPRQRQRHSDMLDSIKSLKLSSSSSSSSPRNISPSMDALRDYYGLKPTDQTGPNSHPPLGLHRKCKSLANGMSEQGGNGNGNGNGNAISGTNGIHDSDSDTWYDRWMRRRRSEIDLQNQTPETMLKPDTSNSNGAFAAAGGKGLALRPKAASRTAGDADGLPNMPPLKMGESVITEASNGVKKSSSSPSFHEMQSNGNSTSTSSSIWPTSMLNLTADIQASTAAIARPIFDGLPKPISGRKNKAAID
ncbi:unnamed protein product [Lactuca saligna]|uniref:LysM domain-containing protein n=1 Tax=Lactuca saligna TaxID=75948 RepID=A0AA35ZRS3_LACSI|nr:unnamed protein product [Lactuca saligna]